MHTELLERHFGKIGARVKARDVRGRSWSDHTYEIDIRKDRVGEYFDLAMSAPVAFTLLQARPDQRHLLLLGNDGKRFLCGHDERHWFVAGIAGRVSTVAAAKQSLMPPAILEAVSNLPPGLVDNRSNIAFRRQGEWFFVKVKKAIPELQVLRDEPIRKSSRNKPHICSELYREGGELVYMVRGLIMTEADYQHRLKADPRTVDGLVRTMIRNPKVFVRGAVRHADHSTVHLDGWHQVFMNAEFTTNAVAFLD